MGPLFRGMGEFGAGCCLAVIVGVIWLVIVVIWQIAKAAGG
jgi:hypothetical protein